MSYPDIAELSNAYTLCTCGAVCTRACTVCASVTWERGPCVKQLWAERANTIMPVKIPPGSKVVERGDNYAIWEELSDAEIVERTIDFVEKLGMYMEPWQAAALRAILLHGGDVAIGLPRQHP